MRMPAWSSGRSFTRGSEHSIDGPVEHKCKFAVSSRSPHTNLFSSPTSGVLPKRIPNLANQSPILVIPTSGPALPALNAAFVKGGDNSITFTAGAQILQPHVSRSFILGGQAMHTHPGGAHCFLTPCSSCHTSAHPPHGSFSALAKSLIVRLWSYLPNQGPSHSLAYSLYSLGQLCLLSAVLTT